MAPKDGSYVDPILNSAAFSQVDLRAHLPSLLELDLPYSLLPTFLHEATHHWCFQSPVGNTIALLRLRAHRTATQLRADPHADLYGNLLEDVLRTEGTIELLRPLAEGLACFSEFDSVPGSSNALSSPLRLASYSFKSVASEKEDVDPNFLLYWLLYPARTHPTLWERRENVLASRFDPRYGGHLAGYMAVKGIWSAARKYSDLVWDSELFLSFLRSYFYDDYGLVAKLLDPEVTEATATNAIFNYVLKRFKRLLTGDLDERLRAFEKSYFSRQHQSVRGEYADHAVVDGIDTSPELHSNGVRRLESLLKELDVTLGPVDLLEMFEDDTRRVAAIRAMMKRLDQRRVLQRELMRLGSLEARVRVNEYQRVIVSVGDAGTEPHPVFAGVALEQVAQGEADGSIEVFVAPVDHMRILAVFRGTQCVHATIQGDASDARKETLRALVSSSSTDAIILQHSEQNLEHVIAEDAISIVRSELKGGMHERIGRLYSWLGTLSVREAEYRVVSDLLERGGGYELFDRDVRFLRALAFIGPAASVLNRRTDLDALAQEHQIDLQPFFKSAEEHEAKTGIETVVQKDGFVLSYL